MSGMWRKRPSLRRTKMVFRECFSSKHSYVYLMIVPSFRVGKDPYQGLVDCVQKIVEEEGWPVLYRGFFFTFAGALLA